MRPLTPKQISGASLLIVLLGFPAIAGQTTRHRQDPFRKFVTRLPDVDRLEIVEVKPVLTDDLAQMQCNRGGLICAPDNFPYQTGAKKTLTDLEAKKFARFWRTLTRDRLAPRDRCLTPDHVLRFFKGDSLILQTQICASCEKISLPTIGVVAVEGHSYPYYSLREALVSDAELRRRWERFKQKMNSQVGKQLSFIGLITQGKGGLTIDYDEWVIWLSGVDLAQVNMLNNLGCHTAVKVSGVLQYHSNPMKGKPTDQQQEPDHFYFERPQIEVVRTNGRYERSRR